MSRSRAASTVLLFPAKKFPKKLKVSGAKLMRYEDIAGSNKTASKNRKALHNADVLILFPWEPAARGGVIQGFARALSTVLEGKLRVWLLRQALPDDVNFPGTAFTYNHCEQQTSLSIDPMEGFGQIAELKFRTGLQRVNEYIAHQKPDFRLRWKQEPKKLAPLAGFERLSGHCAAWVPNEKGGTLLLPLGSGEWKKDLVAELVAVANEFKQYEASVLRAAMMGLDATTTPSSASSPREPLSSDNDQTSGVTIREFVQSKRPNSQQTGKTAKAFGQYLRRKNRFPRPIVRGRPAREGARAVPSLFNPSELEKYWGPYRHKGGT